MGPDVTQGRTVGRGGVGGVCACVEEGPEEKGSGEEGFEGFGGFVCCH